MGWSDGGIVGLVLAATRPDLVRRLVVVGGEESLLPKERAAWAALVDTSSWSERALERFKQAQGPLNWPGIFERMLTGYNAVLDAGGEIIGDRLHEIRCPVLVIHGDADPVVPVEHPHVLRERIANAEVHIWPGVGHLPHREREPEFQRLTLEFLTRP
jgi:valacyclovir hydrolase